jgi:hypothetical protein
VYKVLMGKPEGNRPVGRPRRKWEDGIAMDRRVIGWRSVEWIELALDRDRWRALVNTVMNLLVLSPRSYSQRVRRKSLREGGGSGAVRGESFTGGWTKGLLLVENSVTHQGVTLLHTD